MSADDDRLAKEDLRARERLRYQWMLESVTKFRLFFVGLVFAMLAFAVQFSLPGTNHVVRWSQFVAWVLLLITGCLAIRDSGGFVPQPTEPTFDGLSTTLRRIMWACFVLAIGLLIAARLASQLTTTKGA